ncbi:VP2 [Marbled eel reovirus]|nr:VP2 [Marbled eel reovirus]
MPALFDALPPPLQQLSIALSGERPLDDEIFTTAATFWHGRPRSHVYELLDALAPFTSTVTIPCNIFKGIPWNKCFAIDQDRVIRIPTTDAADDVYVPNSDISTLLTPLKTIPDYGTLKDEINTSAAQKRLPSARMASTFYKIASSQARQVKIDPTRMLEFLLVARATERVLSGVSTDQCRPRPLETFSSLHAIHLIMQMYRVNGKYFAPALIVPSGAVWWIPPIGRTNVVSVQYLLTDLINLAIVVNSTGMSPELELCATQLYLAAAASHSYAHVLLKLKSVFPALSLHSMYREKGFGGVCPRIEWCEPRQDYKFRWVGHTVLHDGLRPLSPTRDDETMALLRQYGLDHLAAPIIATRNTHRHHTHASVRFVRDVMALTSGMYLVRQPTMSVLQEYTQTPVINEPIPARWWSGPIGNVRYLLDIATGPARWLYDTWREAARQVINDRGLHDPLQQAVLRTQFVTARGGSGASLKESLRAAGVTLPEFAATQVKRSTKIYQAAQVARVPFIQLVPAVHAEVTMGIRNQVQRRARSIMPLNVVQQTVSVPHTLVANYINKHMNLSTTSGSAVTDKVVPLLLYASVPPRTVVNIDIKACDASITYSWFLSLICGAMHEGFDAGDAGAPFMNVPPTATEDHRNPAIPFNRPLSGMQTMVQHLASLYASGFSYSVSDAFSSGNKFTLPTSTFPSGSTATSTEHTANNSAMMSYFLSTYVPNHAKSLTLKRIVADMSIRRNYVCQGDDGILILPDMSDARISREDMDELLALLKEYGKGFGWVYDIDWSDTAEYLKLYALFGARVPNVSRHPPVGKEHASAETGEVWPNLVDICMGNFHNGVTDVLQWREWLRFSWAFACYASRGTYTVRGSAPISTQYPIWAFVYLGLPPICLPGQLPFTHSLYMPPGAQGLYAILNNWRDWLVATASTSFPPLSRPHPVWGSADVPRVLERLGVYRGYYAAQAPRKATPIAKTAESESIEQMSGALSQFLLFDPTLKSRVMKGTHNWRTLSESHSLSIGTRVPSLLDVPNKWVHAGREAEKPSPLAISTMMGEITSRSHRAPRHFSRLLELYLRAEVVLGENIKLSADPTIPIVAGADPDNDDPWLKLASLGPVPHLTRKYFDATLFVGKTVSGLDVEAVDATLLRLKILGAPEAAFIAVLNGIGMSDAEAHQLYGRISLANAQTVQLARVVNLAIPSSWMTFDFDNYLRLYAHHRLPGAGDPTTIIRDRSTWLVSILKFLGASYAMTQVGPVRESYVKTIHGSAAALSGAMREWMRLL